MLGFVGAALLKKFVVFPFSNRHRPKGFKRLCKGLVGPHKGEVIRVDFSAKRKCESDLGKPKQSEDEH